MPQVRYIGPKAVATDRMSHSGKVWNGKGDVQDVTAEQAKILCKYTDSFELVVEEPAADVAPKKGKKAKADAPAEGDKPDGEKVWVVDDAQTPPPADQAPAA